MSQDGKKRADAIRLLEAMSGVDESLLLRSEKQTTTGKPVIVAFRKYKTVVAAAVCVLVVGVALWQTGVGTKYANESASTGMPASSAETAGASEATPEMAPEMAPVMEEAKEEVPEGAMESVPENATGSVAESATEQMTDSASDIAQNGVSSAPKDERLKLTEAQARDVETLGAYIPGALPVGYRFEEAALAENADGESVLSVTWTRDLDYITLRISMAQARDMDIIDVARTELYDVSLYDIPYAQTVPEDYREQFNHPVFAAQDLNGQTIAARMKVVADAGDTATPRGNFGVYYEEGVLVEFSGRGTVEEIRKMFEDMP